MEKDANGDPEAAAGKRSPPAAETAANHAGSPTGAAVDPASAPEEPVPSDEDEDAALERLAGTDHTGAPRREPPVADAWRPYRRLRCPHPMSTAMAALPHGLNLRSLKSRGYTVAITAAADTWGV